MGQESPGEFQERAAAEEACYGQNREGDRGLLLAGIKSRGEEDEPAGKLRNRDGRENQGQDKVLHKVVKSTVCSRAVPTEEG